jgi:hypothetical protein
MGNAIDSVVGENGRMLLAGTLWAPRLLQTTEFAAEGVNRLVAYKPSDPTISPYHRLAIATDREIRVVDSQTFESVGEIRPFRGCEADPKVADIAVIEVGDTNEPRIVALLLDGAVRVWSGHTLELLLTVAPETEGQACCLLAYREAGQGLARVVVGGEGPMRVMDVETGELVHTLEDMGRITYLTGLVTPTGEQRVVAGERSMKLNPILWNNSKSKVAV